MFGTGTAHCQPNTALHIMACLRGQQDILCCNELLLPNLIVFTTTINYHPHVRLSGCAGKRFKAEHTWDMVVVKSISKLSIHGTWLWWKAFQSWTYMGHGCGEKRFKAEHTWDMVVVKSISKLNIHGTWLWWKAFQSWAYMGHGCGEKYFKAEHTWDMVVVKSISKLSIHGTWLW